MKTSFVKIMVVLLLSTGCASALEFKDFLGSWSGTRKEIKDGVGYYAKIRIRVTQNKEGDALWVEKGYSQLIGDYTAKHNMKIDGKYTSRVYYYGFIASSDHGTWRRRNGKILITSSKSGAKLRGQLEMPTQAKLKYTAIDHDTKVVISVTRSE